MQRDSKEKRLKKAWPSTLFSRLSGRPACNTIEIQMLSRITDFFQGVGDFSSFAFRATWKGITEPIKPKELLVGFYTIGYQTLPVVLFAALFAGCRTRRRCFRFRTTILSARG